MTMAGPPRRSGIQSRSTVKMLLLKGTDRHDSDPVYGKATPIEIGGSRSEPDEAEQHQRDPYLSLFQRRLPVLAG